MFILVGIIRIPQDSKPPLFYTFYVRAGQPFRGHPQGFPSILGPPRLYILRVCLYFEAFMGQLEILDPLVLYISCFLDTEVYSW